MKTNQYSIAIDDIVAFADFDFVQSQTRSQYLQRMRLLSLIVMLMIFVLVSWIAKSYTYIILGVPASILFFLKYPSMMKRIVIKSIKRTYLAGENKNTFAMRNMEVLPDKLIVKTEYSESSINWKSIERLLENDNYIYIYTSTTAAIILPKSAIPVDVANQFMNQTKKYYEDAKRSIG